VPTWTPSITTNSLDRLHPDDRAAVHPFRVAEELTPDQIAMYYNLMPSRPLILAWMAVENGIAGPTDPKYFDNAEMLLKQDQYEYQPTGEGPLAGQFASSRHANHWYDVAMLQTFLPAFRERAALGYVTLQTAGLVYRSLVEQVMPYTVNTGDVAEAMIMALAARAVALGHSTDFLFLSSPREGLNHERSVSDDPNDKSKVFNHDCYLLPDGTKIPIEVKLHGSNNAKPPSNYDPSVVYVRLMNDIGPYLVGHSRHTTPEQRRIFIPKVLAAGRAFMQRELQKAGRPLNELNLAYLGLVARIGAHPAPPEPDLRLFSPVVQQRQRKK
jgi:hypothetical protein